MTSHERAAAWTEFRALWHEAPWPEKVGGVLFVGVHVVGLLLIIGLDLYDWIRAWLP